MVFGQIGITHPSLAAMVDLMRNKLTREAMHMRFTKSAVRLLKKCLEFALQIKLQASELSSKELQGFKAVKILDSSSWDINEKLSRIFAGSGGSASKANCKVQTIYDYKHSALEFFKITPGTIPDQKYSAQLPALVNKDELIIFDRGYFRVQTLYDLANKDAYFLTRLVTSVNLFDHQNQPFALQQSLQACIGNTHEFSIILNNSKVQVSCRLLCLRAPAQVAEARRRKLYAEAKKGGSTPSRKTLALCDWTLLITNAPAHLIPIAKSLNFYALRWQIELIFKQFKSVLAIHHSNTSRHLRLLCEIYGKLIAATLLSRYHATLHANLWNAQAKELSFDKFFKRFKDHAFVCARLLLKSALQAVRFCESEFSACLKNCQKVKQKSRPSSLQKLSQEGGLT